MSDIHPLYKQHVARHRLARSAVDGHAVIVEAGERFLLPPDVPKLLDKPKLPRRSWWRRVREWLRR